MDQSPVTDSNCVQVTFKHNADELVVVKRVKREPGAVTAKNVLVLKNSDVTTRDEMVFMPNTIEMAQLKKAEKGQFKTNVQISSKMTEMDIKRILVENFPFLEYRRFWCAAAVDNRTRLDFHGHRRIWDGQAIKRKIKGNSALYIFTEEDPKESLKRSHDQITSVENGKFEQPSGEEAAAEDMTLKLSTSATAYPGLEKPAKLFAAGLSPKYVENNPNMGPSPGTTETAAVKGTLLEKGGHLYPNEGQLVWQKGLDRVAEMKGYVCVTCQHSIISPVSHPSKSSVSIQESRNAKDVVTGAASLSHSMRMGTVIVPGGIVVAQPGMAQIISTASDQQSLGKPMFHPADGHFEARHSELPQVAHTVPRVMVSSTLTPRMSNLSISKVASMQFQKPVDGEKCTGKRDQSAQAEEDGDLSQHVFPVTKTAKTGRSFADELCKKGASGQWHDPFRSFDESKQTTDVNTQVRASNRHHDHVGTSASDGEYKSSELSDSGVETSDGLGEDISKPKKIYPNVAVKTQRHGERVDDLDKAKQNTSGISGIEEEGDLLQVLSDVASNAPKVPIEQAVTEKKATVSEKKSTFTEEKSIVNEIFPNRSSVRGGITFMLVLGEHLPADVEFGYADFVNVGCVDVKKLNEFNMVGEIPAANSPGEVIVKVHSSDGRYLGETPFCYEDEVEDLLQLLVHDYKLQARYFRLLAKKLENKTSETGMKQTPKPSSFKNTGSDVTGVRKNWAQQLLIVSAQLLKDECSCSANFPTPEPSVLENPQNAVTESDYDSDDEASSTDSSEDVCCCTGGFDHKSEIISCKKTGEIDRHGLQEELDSERKQCAFQFSESQITQNMAKQATSWGSQSDENNHIHDTHGEEQIVEQLNFFSLLTTKDVAIKDNIENLSSNLQESEPASCPLDSAGKMGTFVHNSEILSCNKTGEIDGHDLHQKLDGERKQCAFQFSKSQITENMAKQATSWGSQSDENDHIHDTHGEEQILEQLNFFSLLTTKDVAIKDNIENLPSNIQESEPASCPLDSAGKMGTFVHNSEILSCNKTGEIDRHGLHQELDGERKECALQFSKSPVTQNMTKQATSSGSQSDKNDPLHNTHGEEQNLKQLNFFNSLTTKDVTIKDNIENLSSNLQESEPASCPLDCEVSPLSRIDTETLALVSQGQRKEVPERSNMPGNTEFIHEQLNVDLDENSVSDKTRRSNCVIKGNQVDNRPAADL